MPRAARHAHVRSGMRSTLGALAAIGAAFVWSWLAWLVAMPVSGRVFPVNFVVVGALVAVGLWLLAWRSPAPWWALMLAIVPVHVAGVVSEARWSDPAGFPDRHGVRVAVTLAGYTVVVLMGAFGAWLGGRRRARDARGRLAD